jgi:myo-inositol 2-dehydrogenase / D-chiro-inositol 1-dehydrogenase
VAVCDTHRKRAEFASATATSNRADVYQDYRRVLDRHDIEAVIIATPCHWHAPIAFAAMKAGKDVYCEKPLTLTVNEGKMLVEAVEQTGCILQVGTQQRSDRQFRLACELVRNGRLGRLQRVTVSLPRGTQVGGPFPPHPVPTELDWELWQGPAPAHDYCHHRMYFFNDWFEYGGGVMTGWGSHHLDIVHWALGIEAGGPVTIHGKMPDAERKRIERALAQNSFNVPISFTVELTYPGDIRVDVVLGNEGILFEGDCGRIYVNRQKITGKPIEELAEHPLPSDAVRLYESNDHMVNFLDCVKSRRKPISDVVSQHRAATACHLANISMRLGRKLNWDSSREVILSDEEANEGLSRPARAPYTISV